MQQSEEIALCMKLVNALRKRNILKYREFTLRSGITTHFYCDIKECFGDPALMRLLVRKLAAIVPKNATCIAGSGYGGVPLASLLAHTTKLPLVLVRDSIKAHGTKKHIDGYVPKRTDRICIVDDVFTTGSSITNTIQTLSVTKAKFTKPIVVLDRSGKKEVLSLVRDEDLK